jgi:hypothetical protein
MEKNIEKTELRLQAECFQFHWNQYPNQRGLFFRIKNEGTNRISGARDKASGVVSGVADSCLLLPKCRGVVFVEFKTETGKQSITQRNWQLTLEAHGYTYTIIRNINEFKELCQKLEL